MKVNKGALLAGAAVMLWCMSCRDDSPTRSYEEKSIPTATKASPAADRERNRRAGGAWRWETPETWQEERGTAMRAAAFRIADGEREAECTIIPLAGEAGGISANIGRWLDQLALPPLAEEELKKFLDASEKWTSADGWPAMAFDFSTLKPADSGSSRISGMAAILRAPGETLFIKIIGERKLVVENRGRFLALCHSIRIRTE
jgi:hypothetical protein